jgi:hypothetical protein
MTAGHESRSTGRALSFGSVVETKKEAIRSLKRHVSNAVYVSCSSTPNKGSGRTLRDNSVPA